MRIESISLDLCIGNKASLVWVGQDHFFHRLKFLELIVDQTPIPACFNDGFAWPFQTGKKLRKPSCAIAFDSSLAQLPPALIQRAQHAVLLVDIYSDVVHENSFLSSSSLRTGMLLSCYLTPFSLCYSASFFGVVIRMVGSPYLSSSLQIQYHCPCFIMA